MLGVIMAIIDTSIVNVALDTVAGNLGASVDEASWIATGYILASVIVMPLNGWLTAYLGRKRFYAACLAIFTVSSFLCGTASGIWQLVFYRVIQGAGGGALQPTAQAILFESYPPERRGAAMAIFGVGAMAGPAIGPTLGGYIIDNASWPLIFYINLPIGIVAFVMTLMFIRDPAYIAKPERGIDWVGLGALAAGLASLQYVLERGEHDDWFNSPGIVVLLTVAAVGLCFFVVRELLDPAPLVDLRVFRSRAFTAGNLISLVSGFGLFGLALILPLFFQDVLRFTATEAGMALVPGAIATAISMPIAGRLLEKLDGRAIIAGGLVLFGWAAWWMGGLNQYAGYWDVLWPRALQGFALGFQFVPLSTATLAAIPRAELANATGIYTLLRQLGGSLGIAILTTLLDRHAKLDAAALSANATLNNPAVRAFLADPATRMQHLQTLNQLVAQNAIMSTYDYLFRLSAVVFFVSVPMVLLLSGKRRTPGGAPPAAVE
jgi:MFS transporter, DHA2 family, multidrug resistance protein